MKEVRIAPTVDRLVVGSMNNSSSLPTTAVSTSAALGGSRSQRAVEVPRTRPVWAALQVPHVPDAELHALLASLGED